MTSGWYGVDLDGTLAIYAASGVYDGSIGEPVPAMLERVKNWLGTGIEVRIVTARVAEPLQKWEGYEHSSAAEGIAERRRLIEDWCLLHLGKRLVVTAQKDYSMIELWDDRAVQIEPNTGRRMDGRP
jgi:hypothetical protein